MPVDHRLIWRAARQLVKHLLPPPVPRNVVWEASRWLSLHHRQDQLETCRQRHWNTAALSVRDRLAAGYRSLIEHLYLQIEDLEQRPEQTLLAERDVYAELCSLFREFPQCSIDLDEREIRVDTEPIELEGQLLGQFQIRLSWKAAWCPDAPAYVVEALDPNYPDERDDITHPHVKHDRLCEGEAAVPLRKALTEGRIADFFAIINRVLHTYNSHSPYVPLEEWNGAYRCHACAVPVTSDATACAYCEGSLCDVCLLVCPACEGATCEPCSTTCPACEFRVCHDCLRTCAHCPTAVCANCLHPNALCEECHAAQTPERKPECTSEVPLETAPASEPAVHADGVGQAVIPA